mmetsp:Transcript_53897/g.139275  ORF Transcript_53897/g.139275 Transcript_53897/m.139275 type:complete len:87 (+) Transcript_53897:411-671(+)
MPPAVVTWKPFVPPARPTLDSDRRRLIPAASTSKLPILPSAEGERRAISRDRYCMISAARYPLDANACSKGHAFWREDGCSSGIEI